MSGEVTFREKLACVERELAMRRNVYPKWVKSGRMKADSAEHQIRAMEAVVEDYRKAWRDAEAAVSVT